MPKVGSMPIVQMGWVVTDLDEAVRHWVNTLGAGPFYRLPHNKLHNLTYRGKSAEWDHSSAVGQWGTIQVELMEQHCSNPSGIRDFYAPGQSGPHHITWVVENFEAEKSRLEQMGFPAVMTGNLEMLDGMPMGWFDARPVLGLMAEVYEECETLRRSYAWIARQAVDWDGKNSFREV